ncbi:hypothetical protein E2C01_039276 [Portunus trituberculatus]|uniref:Uncharacterized protein n=1 Tax=Portunus trituberculatus TaxID=210409 RepID=A0A5B7FGF4_PORTR|nr:hypothetical protein [Portunus trituberculatus]
MSCGVANQTGTLGTRKRVKEGLKEASKKGGKEEGDPRKESALPLTVQSFIYWSSTRCHGFLLHYQEINGPKIKGKLEVEVSAALAQLPTAII